VLAVLFFSPFFLLDVLFCHFLVSFALLVPKFVSISLLLIYFRINPLFYLYITYFAIKKKVLR